MRLSVALVLIYTTPWGCTDSTTKRPAIDKPCTQEFPCSDSDDSTVGGTGGGTVPSSEPSASNPPSEESPTPPTTTAPSDPAPTSPAGSGGGTGPSSTHKPGERAVLTPPAPGREDETPCQKQARDDHTSCLKEVNRYFLSCLAYWERVADRYCSAKARAVVLVPRDYLPFRQKCETLTKQACDHLVRSAKVEATLDRCMHEVMNGGPFYDALPERDRDWFSGRSFCEAAFLSPCETDLKKAMAKCNP